MSDTDISDYVASSIVDSLSRLPGVGNVGLFGSQYAMRIWCDPAKFTQYGITPTEVAQAIREQNTQSTGGKVGGMPALSGQQITLTVNASKRFSSVEQFENILLRVNTDGSALYLKDVARVELNSESFGMIQRLNGKPAAALRIMLADGANALQTADAVKAELKRLEPFFPPGLKFSIPYDTTPFVKISIIEVYKTLGEAIVLVCLVMFLFLQNLRATLIPTIAVPVVLLGTFAVLAGAGYSINTLTLFGLVLSIGLLVDDAIVVVENVERIMREEGLSAKEATRKSMKQVSGALVGISMALSAVFVPMAFLDGSAGVIFRQFSLTIVTSMGLSVFVALSLTPALCATLLRTHAPASGTGWQAFDKFNRGFERMTASYRRLISSTLSRPGRCIALYCGLLPVMALLFFRLPPSFLPNEDMGVASMRVQLPPGASMERTLDVCKQVEQYFMQHEKELVDNVLMVSGSGGIGAGTDGDNAGFGFIQLKDWSERKGKGQSAAAVIARARARFATFNEGQAMIFAPPAVVGFGSAMGFDMKLVDRQGQGHDALAEARDKLLDAARAHPDLRGLRATGLPDVEQYTLDVDLPKAAAFGVQAGEIYATISAFWGGMYINDFMDKGRTKRVYLQADAPYRMQYTDFDRYHVRNIHGEMVPFSTFIRVQSSYGPPSLERYNGLPSMGIQGEAAPGFSTGQAITIMEDLAAQHTPGFEVSWVGVSYEERKSGSQAPLLYTLSIIAVFLCLAALYESWSIPFSVMLTIPFGVLGALSGMFLRGMSNDVYLQVGLLAVIGLSAKNAILIVEFAKTLSKNGEDAAQAALQAIQMRLRPIIMTSAAFLLGVLPLAISSGAGSGSQNAIGTVVMAGVGTATVLGVFCTPLFFVLTDNFASRRKNVDGQHISKKGALNA